MRFPSKKEIERLLASITEDDYSIVPPKDAPPVDKAKYDLCRKFNVYLRETNTSQAELARQIDVDRSRINWIVKYRIEHFTIDKLLELWTRIDPKCQIKIS